MPTYQYACTACGHRLEAVQSFTDDPLTECPECTGRLRKVFGSVGVVFKGSGFYRTDSRASGNGNQRNGAAAGSGEGATGSGGEGGGKGGANGSSPAPAGGSGSGDSGSSGSGSGGSGSSGSGSSSGSSGGSSTGDSRGGGTKATTRTSG